MIPQPSRLVLGGLSCLDFPGEPGAPTVVCFHGYGADARDLAPLALEVPQSRRCRWVFPDGARSLPEAYMGGRSWFEIESAELDRLQRAGPVDWSGRTPVGLAESRAAALALVAALEVPWERVVLAGFSQGAVLSVDAALRAPAAPLGVALLSGTLVSEKEWRARAPRLAGLPFFQSHGLADPLLGFRAAQRLEALLTECGWKGRLLSFEGGHTLPAEVLAALGSFLDSLA